MQHDFNDLEGLRIAVEMEKRGAEFYRRATRISRNERAVALLNRLCADETRHQAQFQALYDEHCARSLPINAYDGETSAYLSAIAADIVYPEGLVALARDKGLDSPANILRSAIQAEKDSILFYSEISRRAADERARSAFELIASEERGHLADLQARLLEES